jgi:hypothetical protein
VVLVVKFVLQVLEFKAKLISKLQKPREETLQLQTPKKLGVSSTFKVSLYTLVVEKMI